MHAARATKRDALCCTGSLQMQFLLNLLSHCRKSLGSYCFPSLAHFTRVVGAGVMDSYFIVFVSFCESLPTSRATPIACDPSLANFAKESGFDLREFLGACHELRRFLCLRLRPRRSWCSLAPFPSHVHLYLGPWVLRLRSVRVRYNSNPCLIRICMTRGMAIIARIRTPIQSTCSVVI